MRRKHTPKFDRKDVMGESEVDSQQEQMDDSERTSVESPERKSNFDVEVKSLTPFHIPADIYIELTEGLQEQFERNHPHLYRELNRAIWQNYGGMR